jgi:hypothetical protein
MAGGTVCVPIRARVRCERNPGGCNNRCDYEKYFSFYKISPLSLF